MRVFFSHSSRDKALLRELRGYFPPWLSTWIDEDELIFGADLAGALADAINERVDFVVLFLGREAFDSEWVQREIAWALAKEADLGRIFLLPVLLVADLRDRLAEVGLSGRLTLEVVDYTRDGTKLLADRLINHLGRWMSEMLLVAMRREASRQSGAGADEVALALAAGLTAIPPNWRPEVDAVLTAPFLQSLASSRIGRIPLSASQYYQRILAEMNRAGRGWEVLAVSTLASRLWTSDDDQGAYAERNLAAVSRGATVHRIFIGTQVMEPEFRQMLGRQVACGIDARIASNSVLAHLPELDDFVLFAGPDSSRAFIAHPSIDGTRSIRSGLMDLSEGGLAQLRALFWQAWELAAPAPTSLDAGADQGVVVSRAPGLLLDVRYLSQPVVSCEEAAEARDVPLANELKTLVLKTSRGFVAAHLPGDGMLSLRKVKNRIEATEARLADPEDLSELGLSAGTVSALLDPVWAMPHLVTRRLLSLASVTTNNGTRTGYFEFDPAMLVEATDVVVGDFER